MTVYSVCWLAGPVLICWPPNSSRKEGREEEIFSQYLLFLRHINKSPAFVPHPASPAGSMTSLWIKRGVGSRKINIAIKGRRPDLNPRPLAVYDTVAVFITSSLQGIAQYRFRGTGHYSIYGMDLSCWIDIFKRLRATLLRVRVESTFQSLHGSKTVMQIK